MHKPVRLVLIDEIGTETIEKVKRVVSEVLETDTRIIENVQCDEGFDPSRGQWRADILLKRCNALHGASNNFVIGLTGKDLYVPSLNFVFGLAIRELQTAIVSYHTLKEDEGTLVSRIAKEVIHEEGHLEGLEHCHNETCVMRFSNTLSETDKKGKDFCYRCKLERAKS